MDKLLKQVLEKITPSREEEEREQGIAKKVMKLIENLGFKSVLVGSLAKGTDLKGDKDIDIFVIFPRETERDDLEEKGLDIAKKVFEKLGVKCEIDYAEHPYAKGQYRKYVIEIVPCQAGMGTGSAVDRTPYHTAYVRKKIAKNRTFPGEVRLLKQFMKGAGVYGAEEKTKGFSGYLAELLVIEYGSFANVLNAASKWRFGQAIDPEHQWKNTEHLKYFFTGAPLVVVDPTDMNRNVAAAVSMQKMAEFMAACRGVLENRTIDFFFPKKEKVPKANEIGRAIKSRGTKLLAVSMKHEKINLNILYGQLRKTEKSLRKEIEHYGFRVMKSRFWTDESGHSMIILEFEVWELPKTEHRVGPSLDMDARNRDDFMKKYESDNPYIEDGRLAVDTQRRFTKAEDVIKKIIEEERGIGKDLKGAKFRILEGKEIMNASDDIMAFLGGFLSITAPTGS